MIYQNEKLYKARSSLLLNYGRFSKRETKLQPYGISYLKFCLKMMYYIYGYVCMFACCLLLGMRFI